MREEVQEAMSTVVDLIVKEREEIDKRFEAVDKRFEAVDRKIDTLSENTQAQFAVQTKIPSIECKKTSTKSRTVSHVSLMASRKARPHTEDVAVHTCF